MAPPPRRVTLVATLLAIAPTVPGCATLMLDPVAASMQERPAFSPYSGVRFHTLQILPEHPLCYFASVLMPLDCVACFALDTTLLPLTISLDVHRWLESREAGEEATDELQETTPRHAEIDPPGAARLEAESAPRTTRGEEVTTPRPRAPATGQRPANRPTGPRGDAGTTSPSGRRQTAKGST